MGTEEEMWVWLLFQQIEFFQTQHSLCLTACSGPSQWHFVDMLTLIRFAHWERQGPLRSQEWPPRCLIWQENRFGCFKRVQGPQEVGVTETFQDAPKENVYSPEHTWGHTGGPVARSWKLFRPETWAGVPRVSP